MAQCTCRISEDVNELFDEAVEETGLFRSDLIRRAVLYYMTSNPDGFQTFDVLDVPKGAGKSVNTLETRDQQRLPDGTYDPTADL